MATKMTKNEMFDQIIAMALGEDEMTVTSQDIVDFCKREKELLAKRSHGSGKPTKTQQENEGYKDVILEILSTEGRPLTIPELMKDTRLTEVSNQRVSALITQLKKAGLVVRTEIKRRAYFSLASDAVEDIEIQMPDDME